MAFAWMNRQLGKYQTAVATLRVRYLVAGAIITATMGVTLLLNLGTDFVTTNFNFIALLGAFYTVAVSVFIIMHRQSHPSPPPPPQPHQPPPPPPEFPNLKIFCKGVYPSLALAFFICIDDPLKSIETLSVPGICLCCYLHILVILAALRRRDDYRAVRLVAAAGSGSVNILRQLLFVSLTQDAASAAADADAETCGNQTNMAYGITDGCIAASYGLIFNSTSSFWIRFLTIIPVIILLGLRNLQFAIPVEEPHVLHQLNQALNQQLIQVNHQLNQALNQQVNHRRRVNQPQASKSSRNHRMI